MKTEFTIHRVANGYLVVPGFNPGRMAATSGDETYVFKTWAQASAWLRKQFEPLETANDAV
jgi:hypothetical protein